jgi:RNA polymerase sigma-70 factor (ECF subfamily)
MDRRTYLLLLGQARRRVRRLPEAEDLLQDALLIALEAGRGDLTRVENRRWLAGVMRNRGLLDARSAARRRRREAEFQATVPDTALPDFPVIGRIPDLPTALRTTALLALTGHTRAEIAWLLRLSDAALRKRISEIRRRLVGARAAIPDMDLRGDLPFGLMRRALLGRVGDRGPGFGSHDPDGNLFVVSSRIPVRRQQGSSDS